MNVSGPIEAAALGPLIAAAAGLFPLMNVSGPIEARHWLKQQLAGKECLIS